MSLRLWWRRPRTAVTEAQRQRLTALPTASRLAADWRQQRWVVIDVETSGLNLEEDEVLSIGAVVIEDNAIDLSQQFEQTLLPAAPSTGPSVLIHGLGPSALAAGREPTEALLDFLEFVAGSPLLAFHAPFDQRMLTRALKRSLDYDWQAPVLDVAELAPLLLPDTHLHNAGLDDWAQLFGLHAEERHHAAADALLTAELMLVLFHRARRQGLGSPQALVERLSQWRRRRNAPGL